jgi:hypothetical protein
MRGSILAIALLLGASVVPFVGSMGACVIQPVESIDAGMDAAPIPPTCDEIGGTCKSCQSCPAVQALCAKQIEACKKSDTCLVLANCNDKCDAQQGDAGSTADCKAACCGTAMHDPEGATIYGNVASCLYGGACPNTCASQHQEDTCGSL